MPCTRGWVTPGFPHTVLTQPLSPDSWSLLVPGASCLCPGLPIHCVYPSLCGRLCWSHLRGHMRTLVQNSLSILAREAWLRGGPATRHRAGYMC